MNLNKKIELFEGDGIPEYNRRINNIAIAVNWLLGVRVINGKPISESDQGPVFDLSPVVPVQPAPTTAQNFATGQETSNSPYPFEPANPIIPPTRTPTLYLTTPDGAAGGIGPGPSLLLLVGNVDVDTPFDWTISATYEGTLFYSVSGSGTIPAYSGGDSFLYPIPDQTGWEFDPQYLAGYAHGSKQWVFPYNGPPTSNTEPQVQTTFTSTSNLANGNFGVVFLAA